MDIRQKETIIAYDNSAKDFMEKMGTIENYNITYDYVLKKLKEHNNVLDLACGPCQTSLLRLRGLLCGRLAVLFTRIWAARNPACLFIGRPNTPAAGTADGIGTEF